MLQTAHIRPTRNLCKSTLPVSEYIRITRIRVEDMCRSPTHAVTKADNMMKALQTYRGSSE